MKMHFSLPTANRLIQLKTKHCIKFFLTYGRHKHKSKTLIIGLNVVDDKCQKSKICLVLC
jgi:hypothetical protein